MKPTIHRDVCQCGAQRGEHSSTPQGYGLGACPRTGCTKYRYSGAKR